MDAIDYPTSQKDTQSLRRIQFWPTPQDYNEALQTPNWCFSDPVLKEGVPELDALGLPKPNSGAFASVYKIQCGQHSYAIRCFLNNIQDQADRYKKISEFILSDDLPYTVPFEYQERGICINGQWSGRVRELQHIVWLSRDPA